MDKPSHFIIKKHNNHYVLINTKGKRKHHTHLKAVKTCRMLVGLVCNKTVPTSDYLKESAKRVSRDYKYKDTIDRKIEKNKDKQMFYRVNRGRSGMR